MGVHIWAGYGLLALMAFRLVWGICGPEYSRVVSFLYPPRSTVEHLRGLVLLRPPHYVGHDPTGALMVFALTGVLIAIVATGLMILGGEEKQGPLSAVIGYAVGFAAKHVHYWLVLLLVALVLGHVAGVVTESLLTHDNLVRAIITGWKRLPPEAPFPTLRPARCSPSRCPRSWRVARRDTGLNLRVSPNEIFQLLALTVMLAPTFDDAQEFGMCCQKQDQIVCLATLYGTTVVVEGTKHHLDREPLQGFAQHLCHLLAARQQHRREHERGVALQRNGSGGARPHVRQIQPPFGQRDASSIRQRRRSRAQTWRADSGGIEDVAQRAVPCPLPQARPQAQRRRTGVRALQAHRHHLIAIGRARTQHLHAAIRDLFPHAGDKALRLVRQVIKPQNAEKPQSEDQHPPHRHAAMISVANRFSLAAASSVDSCHRGWWLKASTMTILLPPSTSPSRSRKTCVFLRSASRVEPSTRAINEKRSHTGAQRGGGTGGSLWLEPCADFRQARAHHRGRQHGKPLGDGLGPDLQRRHPQQAFAGQDLLHLSDRRDPPPHQAHPDGHEDGQRQESLAHAAEPCGCRGARRSSCRGASNDGLSPPAAVVPPLPPLASGSASGAETRPGDGLSCAYVPWGPPRYRGSHDSANDSLWLKLRPVAAGTLQWLSRFPPPPSLRTLPRTPPTSKNAVRVTMPSIPACSLLRHGQP